MKTMRLNYSKGLLSVLFMVVFTSLAFSQAVITGSVVDDSNFPISGAQVNVLGTANAVSTQTDGSFRISTDAGSGILEILDISNGSQQISFVGVEGETLDLGTITLSGEGVSLSSLVVVGRGVIDLAEDRNTPIATSVISGEEIRERAIGNVEFPEAMKNTPNVYISNQSGGFGDGKMFLRGFDQSNTAFLLNGQPINGMEDGKMYWSNWQGMSDIANGIQVQRGLGSSKLAISSVGGTVNIVTKATDKKQGGMARFMVGNDSYFKGTLGYNTGLMESGWGVSIMVDHWQGWRKFAEGTQGQGQNYFLSVGKQAGDHNFNFMMFGAPQSHDQNFSKAMDKYEQYGRKYNNNYGFYKEELLSWRTNYYHKPVMNINWDWNISANSNLSTVLYASFGRGGGTGNYGSSRNTTNLLDPENGLANFTAVYNQNAQAVDGIGRYGSHGALRSSVNNHQWFGMVSNYEHTMENLTFNLGADVRFYKGDHFRQLANLYGLNSWEDGRGRYAGALDGNGEYIVSATFDANPWASLFNFADKKDRIAYDNSEWINYQGVFGQVEYAVDSFSAFFQGSVSNQSYKKEERFSADHEQSDLINRIGYNLKGGAAYNIDENHTLFANAGYYSRQPFLDNIFEYGTIEPRDADPLKEGVQDVENEKITGLEAGYRFTMGRTIVNLNGFYTKWANRLEAGDGNFPSTLVGGSDSNLKVEAGFRLPNMTQVHKGLELDFQTKIDRKALVRGYISYGDYQYDGDSPLVMVRADNNESFNYPGQLSFSGTPVGDAPQVTAGFGTEYEFTRNFKMNADLNYYGKLYETVNIVGVVENAVGIAYRPERLPDFATMDAGFTYKFNIFEQAMRLRGNVFNLLNTPYVSSKDNFGYFFGNGRTWNASITYEF